MQNLSELQFANLSDIGCQRERNEDASGYWQPGSRDELSRKGVLAVIADGMGGYQGGQEASSLAVKTVCQAYAESSNDPQSALVSALKSAHEHIRDHARRNPALFGMGTTCTAACVQDAHLIFAHVGDSRLYLSRNGSISRLTRDHSYVARLIESGLIGAEDAENHPQRHVLTAALGVGEDLVPDCPPKPMPLNTGDVLLLCTDGLWGLVEDKELHMTVRNTAPDHACRELVALAKQRGAPDNVTVQILRFVGHSASARAGDSPSTAF
ncbi:MAG TPA: PP2C family serine/threonine-protein phosphatase [Terriglobales bacterium]|nr:PP2C family serine/threonine-protein phosphatase [Terriglobales bacterium]